MPFAEFARLANEGKIQFEPPEYGAVLDEITPDLPRLNRRRVVHWGYTRESPIGNWKYQQGISLTYFESPEGTPYVRAIIRHGISEHDPSDAIFKTHQIQASQAFHLVFQLGKNEPILAHKFESQFQPVHGKPNEFDPGPETRSGMDRIDINNTKGLLRRIAVKGKWDQQTGLPKKDAPELLQHATAQVQRILNAI